MKFTRTEISKTQINKSKPIQSNQIKSTEHWINRPQKESDETSRNGGENKL